MGIDWPVVLGVTSSVCAVSALVFSAVTFNRTRASTAGPESVVYFVQRGEGGPVKIGTTRDVDSRLSALQTASSEPLILLGTMSGSRALEADLHRAFEPHRLHGEWFKPDLSLLEHVFMVCRTGESCIALLQAKTMRVIEPLSVSRKIEVLDALADHFEDLNRKAVVA